MDESPLAGVSPAHWKIVSNILKERVPGLEVCAFGSRAKGGAKKYSDLDLAIVGNDALPLATLAALADDFSESDLPYKVDVLDWASTSDAFRSIVEKQKVVLLTPSHLQS